MANLNCTYVKLNLEMAYKVVKEYNWLLDCYVLDFFTENHMEKLPKSWKENLQNIPVEGFSYLIDLSQSKPRNVWPLSIFCLRTLIQWLSLPRKFLKNSYILPLNNNNESDKSIGGFITRQSILKNEKIRKLFLKHVKSKKGYEILKIAEITAEIAHKNGINYVVDVGSGLGHLARILAYGLNLNVCSIETQPQLTKQAKVFDSEFEKLIQKYLGEFEYECLISKRPIHLNQTVKFNLPSDEFLKNVLSAFSINNCQFGIVGLHPCGDLASVLLRIYMECPQAQFINLVGCCYHKLSTSSDLKKEKGFPLTQFCCEKYINISYEARSLACHAVEVYSNRLELKDHHHLKVHCYRAALEHIIQKNWPQYRKSALGNVKTNPELDFNKYCQAALKKLDIVVPIEDIKSKETTNILSQWQNVVKFYTFRLMIAPLLETIILLDRKMLLLEKGIPCKIVAAFDPEVSPRNQLLISEKL